MQPTITVIFIVSLVSTEIKQQIFNSLKLLSSQNFFMMILQKKKIMQTKQSNLNSLETACECQSECECEDTIPPAIQENFENVCECPYEYECECEDVKYTVLIDLKDCGWQDNCTCYMCISPELWCEDTVRCHWRLRGHCELLLVPQPYPVLALPSARGRYLWWAHTARAIPWSTYRRYVGVVVAGTISAAKAVRPPHTLLQVVWCNELFQLDKADAPARCAFIDGTVQLLREQRNLMSVSLEGARLERREAVALLDALVGSARTLRGLFLWDFVRRDQNPLTLDETPLQYRGQGAFRTRITSEAEFLRALSRLRWLAVLSLRYSHVSDACGVALLCLGAVASGNLRELQLLCEERDLPNRERVWEVGGLQGGCRIPESTWVKVRKCCPKLTVRIVICNVPCYDQIRLFLSKSMPVKSFHLTTGIDKGPQQHRHTALVLRLLQDWYRWSLEGLTLHLFRNREAMGGVLVEAMTTFPRLSCLEFNGRLRQTPRKYLRLLCRLACSVRCDCLRRMSIALQESLPEDEKLTSIIDDLQQEFEPRCKKRGVKLSLSISNM